MVYKSSCHGTSNHQAFNRVGLRRRLRMLQKKQKSLFDESYPQAFCVKYSVTGLEFTFNILIIKREKMCSVCETTKKGV